MNTLSEMYPVFQSPFPTLLTHTDNGLGIFIAHPKIEMAIKNIGADDNMFRVITEALDFFFPLKEHAKVLLQSRGGVLAFTDESGMPWYTLEIPALVVPKMDATSVRSSTPRAKFGRPAVRSAPIALGGMHAVNGAEGEFTL